MALRQNVAGVHELVHPFTSIITENAAPERINEWLRNRSAAHLPDRFNVDEAFTVRFTLYARADARAAYSIAGHARFRIIWPPAVNDPLAMRARLVSNGSATG
jgi:hypothetical protein